MVGIGSNKFDNCVKNRKRDRPVLSMTHSMYETIAFRFLG